MYNKASIIIAGFLVCTVMAYSALAAPKIYTQKPKGVTIYYPDKCYNGYTLCTGKDAVKLINMNGETVNTWPDSVVMQPILQNGHFIAHGRRKKSEINNEYKKSIAEGTVSDSKILEYDWEGRIVWEYTAKDELHHDFFRRDNGNTILLCSENIPDGYRGEIKGFDHKGLNRKNPAIKGDYIIEVDLTGKVVWEWHEYEHLDLNRYCSRCIAYDWTHTNTVQELPKNTLGIKDPRFKAGNILINPRNLDTIYIIDKQTKKIVWSWGRGLLDHPHHPTMLKNGNIIIFDNRKHADYKQKASRIIELNPATNKIVWQYGAGRSFYSRGRSGMQKLPNGNVLICESDKQRLFEVTPNNMIVWEYFDPDGVESYRAFRIPYDYCPQSAVLPKPKEEPVLPKTKTSDERLVTSDETRK